MKIEDFYFKLHLNTEVIIDDTTLSDGIDMPLPVPDIHFKAKWPDKTQAQILANVEEVVECATKTNGLRTFVHGEDSTRADWNFEKKFINAVAQAGAECYRVCDTVGVGVSDPNAPLPSGIPAKIRAIKKET